MPLKWMSPEALSFNKISNESDVWSYGVLLWEIFTHGQTPYPAIPIENLLSALNSGYRMVSVTSFTTKLNHQSNNLLLFYSGKASQMCTGSI